MSLVFSDNDTSCKIGQAGILNTAGNLTITSVEKVSVKVSELGLIIQ